jgi:hypothetical protein
MCTGLVWYTQKKVYLLLFICDKTEENCIDLYKKYFQTRNIIYYKLLIKYATGLIQKDIGAKLLTLFFHTICMSKTHNSIVNESWKSRIPVSYIIQYPNTS